MKLLDGRPVNGKYWVFYGGLTDFEYTLQVVESTTGVVKTYVKPGGSFCGGADTSAFGTQSSGGWTAETLEFGEVTPTGAWYDAEAAGACDTATELCLLDGQFALSLTATDPRTGATAAGKPIPQNDLFGYFSIPGLTNNPDNPEMFVKMLDGRAVNNRYWAFYGGLTDFEVTLNVRDTGTGTQRTYTKQGLSFCGGADTSAFEPGCTYTLSATLATVASSGGSGTFTVTTSAGCVWSAISGASWLTVTSGSSGNGTGTVSYSATANGDSSSRTGIITAGGRTFTVTQDGTTSSGITWKRIPAGTFMMGCTTGDTECEPDEVPAHSVTLTNAFDMAETETTNGQYKACVAAEACTEPSAYANGDDYPAVNVIWDQAVAFCGWSGGRLATEAEWEYAARGGRNDWKYPFGNSITNNDANFGGMGGRDSFEVTGPVKTFDANGYGLYDMAGNAYEWVSDWHDEYGASPVTNPQGPSSSPSNGRVLRGGSWLTVPSLLRVSHRIRYIATFKFGDLGFRCARDVSP